MTINLMLPHRAVIRRATTDWSSGSPEFSWQDIAKDVPCLFSPREWEQTYADTFAEQSKAKGTVYVEPDCNIAPDDIVKIDGLGTFKVGHDGGAMFDYLGNVHHLEYSAMQVK